MDITAKVYRFDPSTDAAPRYESYDVNIDEDDAGIVTGLQVLQEINLHVTPVAYESSCYCGICGRCAMLIDGEPSLACMTRILPGEHTFEPLAGFPVVRDLVVDTDKAYAQFLDSKAEVQTVNPIDHFKAFDYDFYWEVLDRMQSCRECMLCYSACPALNEQGKWGKFVGPGAMMQIGLRILDGRDESDRVLQAVTSGLFQCTMCGKCSDVCTAHIDHLGVMQLMRDLATARGLVPADAVEVVPGGAFKDSTVAVAPEMTELELIESARCDMPTCHSADVVKGYKGTESMAEMRVEAHVKKKAAISDAQAEALKKFFTHQTAPMGADGIAAGIEAIPAVKAYEEAVAAAAAAAAEAAAGAGA